MKYARKATSGKTPITNVRQLKEHLNRNNPVRLYDVPSRYPSVDLGKIERSANYGLPVTHVHHAEPCTGKHCQECRGTQK